MSSPNIEIRLLQQEDIQPIVSSFVEIGWNKPASLYQNYLIEQNNGERTVLLTFVTDTFAGYLTIKWHSNYPPFQEKHIPEISDFNVLPHFRRRGIGTLLMDEAERIIAQRSTVVGIGVGLHADYGAAQRLYVRRGYVPDGRGIVSDNHFVTYGEHVEVNDGLVLHLTKQLPS